MANYTNHAKRFTREPKFCEVCKEELLIRDRYELKHKRFHGSCLKAARELKLIDFTNRGDQKMKELEKIQKR